jgi:hypothetical protein
MLKLQQGGARSERIHEQIAGVAQAGTDNPRAAAVSQPPAATPPKPHRPANYPEYAEPEVDRPRRYTL